MTRDDDHIRQIRATPYRGRWRARIKARAFRADERGGTAVEFGLIALPLFALLFAIVEAALMFWTTEALETAVADASRRIYTGQFQLANGNTAAANLPAAFKTEVCSRVVALFDCSGRLSVDVQTYSSFPNGVPSPIVTAANGTRSVDPNFGQYDSAAPGDIVLVRAIVRYPVFAALLGANQTNLSASTRLLMATAAFRAEPYK
jgi:Flp pilus assembly protein TadG